MSKIIKSKKITGPEAKKYVKNGGRYCPKCGSEEIESVPPGIMQVDLDTSWIEVRCISCDTHWEDLYKLAGIYQAEEDYTEDE